MIKQRVPIDAGTLRYARWRTKNREQSSPTALFGIRQPGAILLIRNKKPQAMHLRPEVNNVLLETC